MLPQTLLQSPKTWLRPCRKVVIGASTVKAELLAFCFDLRFIQLSREHFEQHLIDVLVPRPCVHVRNWPHKS